jgi:serine/threonine protein kinase
VDEARLAAALIGNEPRRLGPYTVSGRLSSGVHGVVLIGVDDEGVRAAIKMPVDARTFDAAHRERFAAEIDTYRRLDTPHVPRLLMSGEHEGLPWAALELVEGPTLERRVAPLDAPPTPLAGDELITVAADIFDGLLALHDAGVTHRDVHPGNVILAARGAVLVDLGLALTYGDERHTSAGIAIGHAQYVAPEQIWDAERPWDTKADVFAWAATTFFAATGRPPFPSVLARMPGSPLAQPSLDPLPIELVPLVGACLQEDPDDRWMAEEVEEKLARMRPGRPGHPDPATAAGVTDAAAATAGVADAAGITGAAAATGADATPASAETREPTS